MAIDVNSSTLAFICIAIAIIIVPSHFIIGEILLEFCLSGCVYLICSVLLLVMLMWYYDPFIC